MLPPYEIEAMDGDPPEEGDTIEIGTSLEKGVSPIKSDLEVVQKLKEIFDPEIPVNIYDLGLIYDIVINKNGDVEIVMTLTAPACPVAGTLPGEIAKKVSTLDNVGIVSVKITWDPPWTPENMSEVAKVALDMF